MVKREIDFPKPVYKKLEKRKKRTNVSIAAQVKNAVAEKVGEIE